MTEALAVPGSAYAEQDAEDPMFKLSLHLNSGETLVTYVEGNTDAEVEDVASQLFDALHGQGRPGWMQFGNVVAFSGAVGAISIDTH